MQPAGATTARRAPALTDIAADAVGLILTSSSLGDDEREPSCCLARLQLRSTDQSSRHAVNISVYQLALQLYLVALMCRHAFLYKFTQLFGLLTFVQVGGVNAIAASVDNGEQKGSGSGTGFFGIVSPGDSTSCPWNQNGCTNQDLGDIPAWRSTTPPRRILCFRSSLALNVSILDQAPCHDDLIRSNF